MFLRASPHGPELKAPAARFHVESAARAENHNHSVTGAESRQVTNIPLQARAMPQNQSRDIGRRAIGRSCHIFAHVPFCAPLFARAGMDVEPG